MHRSPLIFISSVALALFPCLGHGAPPSGAAAAPPAAAATAATGIFPGLQEPQSAGQVSDASLKNLRALGKSLARLGEGAEVDAVEKLLRELGDPAKEVDKAHKAWNKELAKARPSKSKRSAALKGVDKLTAGLHQELTSASDPETTRLLAELILRFDSESETAHEALGRQQVDGRWTTSEAEGWRSGRERAADLLHRAHHLPIEISIGRSDLPTLRELYGDEGIQVYAHGIHFHGGDDVEKLKRVLQSVLRGLALSHALRGGEMEVPPLAPMHYVLLRRDPEHFPRAIGEAGARGGLPASEIEAAKDYWWFFDSRGWATLRWQMDSDLASTVFYFCQERLRWQPCLTQGHCNWISLNLFGATVPTIFVTEPVFSEARTTTGMSRKLRGILRLATSRAIFASRLWMKNKVRAGERVPWSLAMVDHPGKISGEILLKATLVAEYLQDQQLLRGVIQSTQGKSKRVPAFEDALGQALPVFEEQWRRWLMGEEAQTGLRQRLQQQGGSEAPEAGSHPAVQVLQRIRAEAGAGLFASTEEDPGGFQMDLWLDPELSSMAHAHALYLELNPDLHALWPDVHYEEQGRPGYSVEGNLAGSHAVIAFSDSAEDAIDHWLATFYHRLPLLDPGMFGMGYGQVSDIIVLDCTSLTAPTYLDAWVVWPADNAAAVPRSFRPELPNPVPGENQSAWGYPITLQAFGKDMAGPLDVRMRLFLGNDAAAAAEVACHFLSPSAPKNPELAPANAFCLIPKQQLAASHTYTVVAESASLGKVLRWSFRTAR